MSGSARFPCGSLTVGWKASLIKALAAGGTAEPGNRGFPLCMRARARTYPRKAGSPVPRFPSLLSL